MLRVLKMTDFSDALEFRVADIDLQPAAGLSILVVEDHVLIALDLETMLLDLGAGQVTIANSVDQALQLIAMTDFDAALLDVRVGGTTNIPIATALRDKGVPFAFATGYDTKNAIPEEFQDCSLIAKPYQEQDVGDVIRALRKLARKN